MSTSEQATEARVRRALTRDGQRLCKLRESSRDYAQYGPYMVVDVNSNTVVPSGRPEPSAFEKQSVLFLLSLW